MDVRYSEEQQALRDTAARLVGRLGPHAVGDLGDPGRSAELDAAVAASGWRELRVADDGGSPVASGVEAAIVAEELGRGLADVAFFGPIMAGELRRLAGAPPPVAMETVALRADLSTVACLADGHAPPMAAVDVAGSSTALLLVAASDGGHLVEEDLRGGPAGVDLTRPSTAIDPSVEPRAVDGAVRPLAAEDLARWRALGLSLACADLVGTMRGAVQLATGYAIERRQYGVAIGSFQAVQHLLADAFVQAEGAHSVTLHAAWAVDELPAPEALEAASVAKAYCARAAREVCETAIQVHGGIGNTWECLAHLYLRRALLSSQLLGGAGASLARVLGYHGIDPCGDGGADGLP
jgi:alkylation response protein AidB-like acyl-CoA dehydrogenase